jgi:ABC-2 type transport system ATP-binding protein
MQLPPGPLARLFSRGKQAINSKVSDSAIRIEALEKSFPPTYGGWRAFLQPFAAPTVPALRGISFEVQQGQAVALLGTNGAGKTTLLRILATLLLPSSGRTFLAGHDSVRESAAVRRQLGYHAGSDRGFYARLTGRENLLFFGRLNHLPDATIQERIASLTKRFELADTLNRQVRSLSSGTIQRLSLVRALLHRPKVLLLDEPTRSLDAFAASDFCRFLKSEILSAHGTSLLFASHSLPEIEMLADRVAILHEGRLLACDAPATLKTSASATSLEQVFFKLTGRPIPTALEPPSA